MRRKEKRKVKTGKTANPDMMQGYLPTEFTPCRATCPMQMPCCMYAHARRQMLIWFSPFLCIPTQSEKTEGCPITVGKGQEKWSSSSRRLWIVLEAEPILEIPCPRASPFFECRHHHHQSSSS
jgi:hypothetical protein